MIFIDYSDLNFKTNLWQYSMIIISALGIIMILSDKKFTDNKKKKATIIAYSGAMSASNSSLKKVKMMLDHL